MLFSGKCHDRKKKQNKQTNKQKNIFVKRKRARWRMSQRKPQQSSPAHRFGHNTPPERFFKQTNRKKQKQIWKYDLDTSKVAVYYHTSREVFSNKQTEKKTETDLKIWSWHIKSCSFIKLRLREAGQEHFDSTNIVRDVIFNMWYRHMVTKTCYQSSTLCIVMLT